MGTDNGLKEMFLTTSLPKKLSYTQKLIITGVFCALLGICYINLSSTKQYEDSYEDVDISNLQSRIGPYSEMSKLEQRYLFGLIKKFKPKKIVEIGVSKGGSSAIILEAIKDRKSARLYSIDTTFTVYNMPEKPVGFLVNETFPELLSHWTLFRGYLTADVIDTIGSDIDCVLIDTVHVTPGELLDWLQVLPYLKQNALVIIHDIGWQLVQWEERPSPVGKMSIEFSNNILYYYLRGKKLLPRPSAKTALHNIGAVVLDKHQEQFYFDYFFPLAIHWEYMPPDGEIKTLKTFFQDHYGEKYVRIFEEAISQNKLYLSTRTGKHYDPYGFPQQKQRPSP